MDEPWPGNEANEAMGQAHLSLQKLLGMRSDPYPSDPWNSKQSWEIMENHVRQMFAKQMVNNDLKSEQLMSFNDLKY